MLEKTINVTEDQLSALAARMATFLSGGDVINLHGDVGAGKTTFTCALARALGITDPVQSPTFTIANHYETPSGMHVAHYDFYRLDDPGIMQQELEETLTDQNAVVVIEWGEIIKDVLPGDYLDIYLTPLTEETRSVLLEARGDRAKRLVEAVS